MSQQVQQTRVALKIISQITGTVDDLLQIVNGSFVTTVTEIKCCYLIVEHKNTMRIQEEPVFLQMFFNFRYKTQTLFECTAHQVIIDFGPINIHCSMCSEIIMNQSLGFRSKFFKFMKRLFETNKVAENKVCIQQVMHAFDIVTGFYIHHHRFLLV